jgi:hypothetical protein
MQAMIVGASGTAIYGAIVASFGFVLACASLVWNVINTVRDRRARRTPDVYAHLVIDLPTNNAALAFANAGSGLARGTLFLLVDGGKSYVGGLKVPYLKADERSELDLPQTFQPKLAGRAILVWGFMDTDGNVHLRSNKTTEKRLVPHPSTVDLVDFFVEVYPDEAIPSQLQRGKFLIGE